MGFLSPVLTPFKESGVTALAYSTTLEALVAATLQQIAFFDVSTGAILSTIDRSTSSPALALTMDTHGLVLSSKGRECFLFFAIHRHFLATL